MLSPVGVGEQLFRLASSGTACAASQLAEDPPAQQITPTRNIPYPQPFKFARLIPESAINQL